MLLTCLSNKKSPAPIIYLLLQISGLAGLIYYCPTIISFKEYPEVVLFWLNALLTITFYFNTHLRDPGYIPHDAVFFTDQEQSDLGGGLKLKRRMDSIAAMKSKAKKAAQKAGDLVSTTDQETKERISEMNKPSIKSAQESERRVNLNSTNNLCPTNAVVTENPIGLDRKTDYDTHIGKTDHEEQHEVEEEAEEPEEEKSKLSTREENKQDPDMVDCEPSLEEGEDLPDQNDILDFNARSKTDVDVIDNAGSPLKVRLAKSDDTRAVNNNHQVSKSANQSAENETPEKKQKLGAEHSNNHKNRSMETQKQNNYQDMLQQKLQDDESSLGNKDSLGFSKLFTKEIIKAKVINPNSKKKDYFTFNDEESSMAHVTSATPKEISLLNLKLNGSRALDRPQEGEATKASSNERTSTHKENKKKTHTRQGSRDQSREIMLVSPKFDEFPEMDDLEKQQDGTLYVERRYCTVCDFEQPLRAKHCKECKRCIAQYDHHCPWLGTCIGEKNHLPFYWFLVFQLIEILWGDFKVFDYMFTIEYKDWASENAGRIVIAIILTFFVIMLVSLLSFHTYLAFVNQTTWETLSWYKISYLKEWHEDWGSPFSQGIIKNLHFFCCTQKSQLKRWTMPKYKRPLNKQ